RAGPRASRRRRRGACPRRSTSRTTAAATRTAPRWSTWPATGTTRRATASSATSASCLAESLHAAAAEIVLVEPFEVADLVQQGVADLLGELGAGLHRAGEVLAIQHDRRDLALDVVDVRAAPDRAAVEPEDGRRERRLDGRE